MPLANALTVFRQREERRFQAGAGPAPTHDLIVVADPATPYRLLAEVLYTAGQTEFGKYHLDVRNEGNRPRTPARPIPDPPVLPPLADVRGPDGKLALALFVVDGGYSLKTAAGNIAPGCAGLGAGLTLPKRGADYDLGGLASCAKRIKGTSSDTEVTVTANPGTDFATIADTMDALEGAHKDVFPVVHFGVVR